MTLSTSLRLLRPRAQRESTNRSSVPPRDRARVIEAAMTSPQATQRGARVLADYGLDEDEA